MELEENFARLVEKLGKAFAVEAQGAERHRYVIALLAVAEFLRDVRLPSGTFVDQLGRGVYADKFASLAAALNDLGDGIVRPVLLAEKVKNRIPDSTDVWLGRAFVAISLEALFKAGKKRAEAATYIEKKYPALNALTSKKAKCFQTAALSWYSVFTARRVKNTTAKKVFEVGRIHLESFSAVKPETEFLDLASRSLLQANQISLRLSPHS